MSSSYGYKHKMTAYEWFILLMIPISLWIGIASAVFEARNPLSNKMAFFTEFKDVMTFQKLPKYQPENYQYIGDK